MLFSIIGIIFFRPLFFKKEIRIEFDGAYTVDSIYYSHGFPISALVRDFVRNDPKEYELAIEPTKVGIWIGGIESDIDLIDLKKYNVPIGWKRDEYGWINYYDENNPSILRFKIRAVNYIRILVGYGTYHGAFRIRIDTIIKEVNPYSQKGYVDWYYINLDKLSILSLHVSPESKNLILKFKDSPSNVKVKNYDYEILDNERILIKNLKTDYLKVILNSIFVIAYCFILATVLNYSKSVFFRHFSIIFTIFFIYLLSYFPGIYNPDSVGQVQQAYYFKFDDWHNPFHTLTIAIVLKIFKHVVFYPLTQIIFFSILFAWILNKLNIKLSPLSISFFLFPITGLYSVVVWKDIPYSLSIVYFSFLLYLAYKEKNYLRNNRFLVILIVLLSFIMLFRYNGIPLVLAILILLIFLFKKYINRILIISISLIVIYVIYQVMFYEVLKVKKEYPHYQKDMLAISAYVVSDFAFNSYERRIIEEIVSFDEIKKRYNCHSVNSLFWGGPFNFDKHKEYRRELRKILLKAILIDIKPFVNFLTCQSDYIWSLKPSNFFMDYNKYVYSDFQVVGLYESSKMPQVQAIIKKLTDSIFKNFEFLFKPAIYFYLLLVIAILNKNLRILVLPSLSNSIIMIIISPSDDFRFTYSNYLISIILVLLFINSCDWRNVRINR